MVNPYHYHNHYNHRQYSLSSILRFIESLRGVGSPSRHSPILVRVSPPSLSRAAMMALEDVASLLVSTPSPLVQLGDHAHEAVGIHNLIGSYEIRHMKSVREVLSLLYTFSELTIPHNFSLCFHHMIVR